MTVETAMGRSMKARLLAVTGRSREIFASARSLWRRAAAGASAAAASPSADAVEAWFVEFSLRHTAWLCATAAADFACVVALTVRLAFGELGPLAPLSVAWCVDAVCDALFLADVLVQQRTGFLDPGTQQLVVDVPTLRAVYRRTGALLDAASLFGFPAELVVSVLASPARGWAPRPRAALWRAPRLLRRRRCPEIGARCL